MAAFSALAFSPAAFSTGDGGGDVRIYTAVVVLDVVVSDATVFESSVGDVEWSLRVRIGGFDFSDRLVGETRIEAAEDAARIATLDLVLFASAELSIIAGAQITIDVLINGGGYLAVRRRLTGVVETWPLDLASRTVSITARDDYQGRIKACDSADAVRALFGGLETVSPKLIEWSAEEPDPMTYFQAALSTVPGCTFIDGTGQWQARRWSNAAPVRTYGAGDMFDPGPRYVPTDRPSLPARIVAKLTHTFPRLHNAELALTYTQPPYHDYVIKGILEPEKAMIMSALNSLEGWVVKGNPVLTTPPTGNWPVSVGGGNAYYSLSHERAQFLVDQMSAVVYRRWYQDVIRSYTVTIDMGGLSGRDEIVAREIRTTFDAGAWESGQRSEPPLGVYAANPPPGLEDAEELSGYEALKAPWPPANSAIDHFADMTPADIEVAARQVVAEATRMAAAARRKQQLIIERPVDLRLDIGATAAVEAHGVAGVGQVAAWVEVFDHDAGSCVGEYSFACAAGNAEQTGFSLAMAIPPPDVAHAFLPPTLGTHIGGDTETPSVWINPDTLCGYLCNTLPTSGHYDASRPRYETQFRFVLPPIGAALRDPYEQSVELAATISIAGSGVTFDF